MMVTQTARNHQSRKQEERAKNAGHIPSSERDSCARCIHSEIRWITRLYCSANGIVVNKLDICNKFFRTKG